MAVGTRWNTCAVGVVRVLPRDGAAVPLLHVGPRVLLTKGGRAGFKTRPSVSNKSKACIFLQCLGT